MRNEREKERKIEREKERKREREKERKREREKKRFIRFHYELITEITLGIEIILDSTNCS